MQGLKETGPRSPSPPSPPISRFVGGRCGAISSDTTPPRSPMTGLTYSRRSISRRAREAVGEGEVIEPMDVSSPPETTQSEMPTPVPSGSLASSEAVLPIVLVAAGDPEVIISYFNLSDLAFLLFTPFCVLNLGCWLP